MSDLDKVGKYKSKGADDVSYGTTFQVRQSEIDNMNSQIRAITTGIDGGEFKTPKIRRMNRAILLGSIADSLKRTEGNVFDSKTEQ